MFTKNQNRLNRRRNRRGLSLLEVILAIAILGAALVMIAQLTRLGSQSAERAKLVSHAQILCDAKMAEISAGVLPLESANATPIDEAPDWLYSVEVNSSDQVGLLKVIVNVTMGQSDHQRSRSFRLTRLVPDPNYDPYEPEE